MTLTAHSKKPGSPERFTGQIISQTRRHCALLLSSRQVVPAIPARGLELTVGDTVTGSIKRGDYFISEVSDRKNILKRSYREKSKLIAANLDLLFIVCAVEPRPQPFFVDRVLVAAHQQHIPCALVINKEDLGIDSISDFITTYQQLDYPVFVTSAKQRQSLAPLESYIDQHQLHLVAFTGTSGVGKSSIINALVPGAEQVTDDLSERSGTGKQTTTRAQAFQYHSPTDSELLLVDLPGIQSFGVTHISKSEVQAAFFDFLPFAKNCRYSSCAHLHEAECGVRAAVESGQLSDERFYSYAQILAEIDSARKF